jgi:cell division septation protein DedD
MRIVKTAVTAALAWLLIGAAAYAADGPAELPPAGYEGRQYVDSQGCAFVRASYDGRVVWVPRATADRRQVCGARPTFAPTAVAVVPVRAQRAVAASPVRVASRDTRPVVPAGFKAAWTDGRLNPLRGPRTGRGDLQMAQVLNIETVPMVAATPESRARAARAKVELAPKEPRVVVATKSGSEVHTDRPLYVQVGAFGVAANATATVGRLTSAGLPVRVGRGQGLEVVLAGPFGSAAAAAAGLGQVRRAGYRDAFVRY